MFVWGKPQTRLNKHARRQKQYLGTRADSNMTCERDYNVQAKPAIPECEHVFVADLAPQHKCGVFFYGWMTPCKPAGGGYTPHHLP